MGRVRRLMKPPGDIAASVCEPILASVIERVRQRQRDHPWLMGVTSLGLAQALSIPERDLIRLLAPAVEARTLVYRSGYYATADFAPRLADEQLAFFEAVFAAEAAEPPAPLMAFEHLRARVRSSSIADLTYALETLIASGALSKVGDFVYRGSQLAGFRAQLEAVLDQQGHVTVAEFRDLTQTSRKYALPLLEFFDATGVTQRRGDVRVLRQTSTPTD